MFKEMINNAIDDKITDLFIAMHDETGITSGDVSPLDMYELEKAQNALADIVNRIIISQAKTQGTRVFFDGENQRVVTIHELKRDYLEFIADGTLDKDIYSTFDEYLTACMDYNDGTLTEIR